MRPVVFDVDGVLADFIEGFTKIGNELFGTPVTMTTEQPSWHGFPGMTKAQVQEVWKMIVKDISFWAKLNPLIKLETFEAIDSMTKDRPVYFVTSRPGINTKQQTERWLRIYGIRHPSVIVTKKKGEACVLLDASHAIDDKAQNASCIDWLTDGRTEAFLLTRKYNEKADEFLASGVHRVQSVSGFIGEIICPGVGFEEQFAKEAR